MAQPDRQPVLVARMTKAALVIAFSALAAACATTPRISTDYDRSAEFAQYRTYAWVRPTPAGGINPVLEGRIRDAIDANLASRGYVKAEDPDFAIDVTLGARDRIETRDMGPYAAFYPAYGYGVGPAAGGWRYTYSMPEIRSVTEASMAVDIYDAATRLPVWHGRASKDITPGTLDSETVQAAVDGVMAKFPPTQG